LEDILSDDKQPWERLDDEPAFWFSRFEDYRLLGSDRSLTELANQWRVAKGRERSRSPSRAWRHAAEIWQWKNRAEAWDEHIRAEVAAIAEAERIRILTSGFALKHRRVEALDELAGLLKKEVKTKNKRWVPDVKSIGSGENAERVDIVRFNAAIIEQFRKTLEDLAAELGERIAKTDLTSGGEKIIVTLKKDD
jgi:hypothetical protein